ncbi:unnamed protein product, partial [Chrysoparadoxa australica]
PTFSVAGSTGLATVGFLDNDEWLRYYVQPARFGEFNVTWKVGGGNAERPQEYFFLWGDSSCQEAADDQRQGLFETEGVDNGYVAESFNATTPLTITEGGDRLLTLCFRRGGWANLFEVTMSSLDTADEEEVEAPTCVSEPQQFWVGDAANATDLAASLNCTDGDATVEWLGEVPIDQEIVIGQRTKVTINGAAGSAADGAGKSRLFALLPGAELTLVDMKLVNGMAQGGEGGAVFVEGGSLTLMGSTTLSNNIADKNGGAVYVTSEGTVQLKDQASVTENTAAIDGGGIALSTSAKLVISDDAQVSNNAARDNGGGIHALSQSTVLVEGRGRISENRAEGDDGGGVFLGDSELTCAGMASIRDNTAKSSGAAFACFSCTGSIKNSTRIQGNAADDSGGAIWAGGTSTVTIEDDAELSSNTAPTRGGNIDITGRRATLTLRGQAIIQAGSTNGKGGGIRVKESKVYIQDSASVLDNKSGSGGGIFCEDEGTLEVTGSVVIKNNNATGNGGGIGGSQSCTIVMTDGAKLEDNETGRDGGALHLDGGSSAIIDGATIIQGCRSGKDGGGLSVQSQASLTLGGNAEVNANAAERFGGAIVAAEGASVVLMGDSMLMGNTAQDGGGIHARDDTQLQVQDRIVIEGNSATQGGGGVYLDFSSMHVGSAEDGKGFGGMDRGTRAEDDNSPTMKNNTALRGGAVNLSGKSKLTGVGLQVIENAADERGGGVIVSERSAVELANSAFCENKAKLSGGAVADEGSGSIVLQESSFVSNTALCCTANRNAVPTPPSGAKCTDYDTRAPGEACCMAKTFSDGGECKACEEGMLCSQDEGVGATVRELELTSGYWRGDLTKAKLRECLQPAACAGGKAEASEDYCNPGYTGPYCAVCATNYFPAGDRTCKKCSPKAKAGFAVLVALIILLVLAAFGLFMMITEKVRWSQKWALKLRTQGLIGQARKVKWRRLRIPLVVLQIVTQYGSITGAVFPDVYKKFLGYIALVNLDMSWVFSLGCIVETDFYDSLLVATILPLAFLLILVLAYLRRSRTDKARARKYQSAFLLVTFLIYSSVSTRVFQTFACDNTWEGNSFLMADYSISCNEGRHKWFRMYAFVMTLIYPIGIPALYLCVLWGIRSKLSSAEDTTQRDRDERCKSLRFLWEAYKPSFYYFEVVECVRRLSLTGIIVFIPPDNAAQLAWSGLFSVAALGGVAFVRPYAETSDLYLYITGMLSIFLTVFQSLLIKVEVSDEDSAAQIMFSSAIIFAQVMLVLVTVALVIQEILEAQKKDPVLEGFADLAR